MSITKSPPSTENSSAPFPTHKCPKWQRQSASEIFSSPCALHIFWSRLLRYQMIEFVLHFTQLPQSNENVSLTSVHKYICYSVEPLLIFDISSNDLPISPESLSRCFSKTGKNLSFSSSLPSVANPYQRVNNSSSFRSLVICFATAPIRICVVFVWSHFYLFTTLKSGTIFLNSLAPWSGLLKGSLCSTGKP